MANNVRDFTVNSLQQFYNKLNNDILPTYASMSYVESAYAYILNEIVDNEYVIAQTFNSHNDRITALENADTPTGTLTGVNLNGNAVTVNNGIAEVNTTYPVTINITNGNYVVDGTTHTVTADHYYNDIQTAINEGKTPYAIFNDGMIIPYIGIITDTQTIEFGTTVNQLSIYISIETNTANYMVSRALTSESQSDWNVTDTSSAAYIKNKPTIPSTSGLATETYVNNKVAGIVNSAPETLDTLNELAAALGNDPDFATTVSNQIGTKVSKTELAGLGYVTQTTLSAQGYITSFTETDPTVPSYVKSITQANINAWNSYANVQADWNATSGDAYIKNKPTIPSIAGLVSQTTLSSQSYVTTTALNTRLSNAGYISSVPAEYITQAELSANGYLTSQTKANWNETNSNSAAYIQNKPTIPAAANNSTITIQKGGTNVDTFTTNAASNKTINIPNELPSYSSSDSGKILSVNSSGQLIWITPVSIYTGSGEPVNSLGNDGDIYLQQ